MEPKILPYDVAKQARGFEAVDPYSKGLKGKITDVYNRAGLSVVCGPNDGDMLKSRHLNDLPYYPSGMDQVEKGDFNVRLPQVIEVLAMSKAYADGAYIEGIGGYDNDTLIPAASRLLRGDVEGVAIRTVMGATEKMPLRSLSYMLPGLTILEGLRQKGIEPPQLQIISAHNISSQLGSRDCEESKKQARLFAEIARSYVEEFFHEISGNVVFLEDTGLESGNLSGSVVRQATEVLEGLGESGEIMRLRNKGASNGAIENALKYGAAHTLIHDISSEGIVRPMFEDQQAQTPDTIISIGGKQEELFYAIRHAVRPNLESFPMANTLQYFSRHHVPPYTMTAQGKDVGLEEILHGDVDHEVAPAARHDLTHLLAATQRRGGNFKEFIEGKRRIYGK